MLQKNTLLDFLQSCFNNFCDARPSIVAHKCDFALCIIFHSMKLAYT